MQARFKIKSIVYEHINDDGTTEDIYLEDRGGEKLGHIKFLEASPNPDEEQRFWIASDHDGLTDGTNVIASSVPGADNGQEWHKDRSNTMIGLIRDFACTGFVIYSPNSFDLAK